MTVEEYDNLRNGDVVRSKKNQANYVIGTNYGAKPKESLKDSYSDYDVVLKVK